jgi:sec-independent protein translocase protein TatB
MAREFSRAMEQAANETGVKDIAKDLQAVTNPKAMGLNAVKDAVDKFEKWDPIKNAAKPTQPQTSSTLMPPPMPAALKPAVVTAEPEAVTAADTGPNTAALYQKKAARDAIMQETAARLKALDEPAPAAPPAAKPKRSPKPKAAAVPVPAAAPKAPRKKKAAEQ